MPRKRLRWFAQLLDAAAKLKATRTLNKRNPRMVKRRNSPFASHDRQVPINIPMTCLPHMLDPPPLHPQQRFPKAGAI